MLYFFADDHYGTHGGQLLYRGLPEGLRLQTTFTENEWSLLESGVWKANCELLILHFIAGTCGQPLPGTGAENAVREYLESGGNILLLHGASAAFWHWEWWRRIVGLRWVRPGDPDGASASMHPHAPCRVVPVGCVEKPGNMLQEFELQYDEVYINLCVEGPVSTLMTTQVDGKEHPQCFSSSTPWGGRIVSFLPGHLPVNVRNPALQANVNELIRRLRGG